MVRIILNQQGAIELSESFTNVQGVGLSFIYVLNRDLQILDVMWTLNPGLLQVTVEPNIVWTLSPAPLQGAVEWSRTWTLNIVPLQTAVELNITQTLDPVSLQILGVTWTLN